MEGIRRKMRKNRIFFEIITWMGILALTGCQGEESPAAESLVDLEVKQTDVLEEREESGDEEADREIWEESGNAQMCGSEVDGEGGGTEAALSDEPETIPLLPETGKELADFVPEGWEIHDSVELDFNGDGRTDYVGVLETAITETAPRILFAIASRETGLYSLDFQDANLVRTRNEGGVFGDPYMPLTAEEASFTLRAYGGSAWKWSEESTYTYREGEWYLSLREYSYGYGPYITSYEKDDWETGVGIRRKRSDEFDRMESFLEDGEAEEPVYDVEYRLVLDQAPTLYQAGMRWWLAPERVTDWTVESVEPADGIAISADRVKHPDEVYLGGFCDEDGVLYEFSDEDSGVHYLAGYRWQDRVLSVLAQEETSIDCIKMYKGKIYYTVEIVETVTYGVTRDGREELTEEEDTVGIRLNRINPDGTGKESIFEYRYPEAEQEVAENPMPLLLLIYEISGDEIVAEVYVGNEPHPVYRMKTDGSGVQQIGQIPDLRAGEI